MLPRQALKLCQAQVSHSQKQHEKDSIVALLASESDLPIAEVARLYDTEHAQLDANSDIKQYLPIFAIRKVREILRRRERRRTIPHPITAD
jgi:tellurite resistance protein